MPCHDHECVRLACDKSSVPEADGEQRECCRQVRASLSRKQNLDSRMYMRRFLLETNRRNTTMRCPKYHYEHLGTPLDKFDNRLPRAHDRSRPTYNIHSISRYQGPTTEDQRRVSCTRLFLRARRFVCLSIKCAPPATVGRRTLRWRRAFACGARRLHPARRPRPVATLRGPARATTGGGQRHRIPRVAVSTPFCRIVCSRMRSGAGRGTCPIV